MMELTDLQIERYARHLVLPEIDEEGQIKLLQSRVLVVGAGGLGSPLLLYLAAAGIGTLGIIDDDSVDRSNLQRQVIHREEDLGVSKAQSAARAIKALNPEVKTEIHNQRLCAENALDLIGQYDLVADGSDNFATRFLVNDAAHLAGRTLVSGAILRFDGQLSTYRSHLGHGEDGTANPCYRCLFGEEGDDIKMSCADVGVLGALAGMIGCLQATEVVKELLGIGKTMAGRLLIYDALETRFNSFKAKADPACPLCGEAPSITSITSEGYDQSSVCAAQ